MNTINRQLFFIIAILSFTFVSCKKENPTPIDGGGITAENTVKASISGIVKDEAGNPVSGAVVKLSSNSTTTDQNGLFFFHNVNTSERSSTVIVSKSGFFNGSRTFFVKAGNRSTVIIRMLSKGSAQTFNTSSGGTVSFASGLSITFPSNGIVVKASGATYNGQVNVYAKMIDPTTNEGLESMPGDLRGTNTAGEERLLQSFGMMVAELYDNSGNALQIASNSSASLSLAVPSSLVSSAPATIPLWYFDEAKGTWIEEGSATLQGGKYIGDVKHFSFWNCDTPAAAIDIQMTLVDQDGTPLQNYNVRLTNTANDDQRWGYTDNNGWVGGLVYSNASLQMEVFVLYPCGETPFYTQTINTGSSNLDLGIITINISNSNSSTITTSVKDCNNNPLLNTGMFFPYYNIYVAPDANGNINHTFPCVPINEVSALVYDFTNNVYGSGTYLLQAGINNLGVLSACGNAIPFINFTVKNDVTLQEETITSNVPIDSIACYDNNLELNISFFTMSTLFENYLSLQSQGNSVGTFNIINGNMHLGSTALQDNSYTFMPTGSIVNFTSVPLIGNVEGSFVMHVTGDVSGQTYTVTGDFRVPKW